MDEETKANWKIMGTIFILAASLMAFTGMVAGLVSLVVPDKWKNKK